MRPKHWARDLIGEPYERFSCWGLVRHVFLTQYGIAMPEVEVANDITLKTLDNVRAIMNAAHLSGWRPMHAADAVPHDRDIVVMRSTVRIHVGVVIKIGGSRPLADRLRVLHSNHGAGVVCEPWADATAGMMPEIWRRST